MATPSRLRPRAGFEKRSPAAHLGQSRCIRVAAAQKQGGLSLNVILDAHRAGATVLDEQVAGARIAVPRHAHAAAVRDRELGQYPGVRTMDVTVNGGGRIEWLIDGR